MSERGIAVCRGRLFLVAYLGVPISSGEKIRIVSWRVRVERQQFKLNLLRR